MERGVWEGVLPFRLGMGTPPPIFFKLLDLEVRILVRSPALLMNIEWTKILLSLVSWRACGEAPSPHG